MLCTLSVKASDIAISHLPDGKAPIIDGVVDNIWDTIVSHQITLSFINESPSLSASWKAIWNDTAIFILVEVNDDFHCDTSCSHAPDWMSDKVEIYFDVNSVFQDGLGPSANNGHYQFSPTFNSDSTHFLGNWYSNHMNYSYQLTGSNYVFEYSLAWSILNDKDSIAFADTAGRSFGFDVCIADRDSANDDRRRAVWLNDGTNGENWINMDHAGILALAYPNPTIQVSTLTSIIDDSSNYNFGRIPANKQKQAVFIIKNLGQQQLNISSINTTGNGFTIIQPSKTSLELDDTLILKVYYQGDEVGEHLSSVQVITNDPVIGTFTINLSAFISSGTIVEQGDVWGTWTKANSPYFIYGDIRVPDSSHLTIQPGVEVIFEGNYMLKVWGALNARGQLGDTIVFKRDETDTIGFSNLNVNDGGWGSIFWDNEGDGWNMWDNDSSILEYCSFKFGKAMNNGGAIRSTFIKVRISHSSFQNNSALNKGGAIYISGGATIDHCTFRYNTAYHGGAIFSDYASSINLNNCSLQWNKTIGDWSSYGGAIYLNTNRSNIQNNLIANNYSSGSAGAIIFDYSNDFFGNNIVANNKALDQGGGIVLRNANPVLVNNTIMNNTGTYTGGIAFWQASASKFYNNIIWGNTLSNGATRQMIIYDAPTVPVFKNCIIQKDSIYYSSLTIGHNAVFTDTICSNPLLNSPTGNTDLMNDASLADWTPQDISPVINRGIQNDEVFQLRATDFYNSQRIMLGVIDIGASEAYIGKVTLHDSIKETISLNADTIEVTGNVVIAQGADLIIPPGTKVLFNGHYEIKVLGAIIAKGTADKPILFSKTDTSGFYNNSIENGGWHGIHINNDRTGANGTMTNEDSCIFEYCTFEFAKNIYWDFDYNPYHGGALTICYYSKVLVLHCDFRNNTGTQGGGLFITDISNPVIKNCRFYNNLGLWNGGGFGVDIKSAPRIENNLITNNRTLGSGGGIYLNSENSILVNNIVYNNHATYQGGGIAMYSTNPIFLNNTIMNNYAGELGGGLNAYNSPVSIYNSVFWNNNAGWDQGKEIWNSNASFYNCIIEGYNSPNWGEYFGYSWIDSSGILYVDPKILKDSSDGLEADFHITQFSGSIDNGTVEVAGVTLPSTDYYGNQRINNGKIDIGAVENQKSKLIFTKQPFSKPLCVGDSISLVVSVTDTAHYQWQKDGNDLPGDTIEILTLKNLNENNSGSYQCKVKNAYGTVYSNNATLQVKSPPSLLSYTDPGWINHESPVTINASVNGSNPLSFKWTKDGSVLTSDTIGSISVASFTAENEGIYKCEISNTCGSVQTPNISLMVAPEIVNIKGASICENDTFKLSIAFNDAANYQWYKDGVSMTGKTGKTFQINKPSSRNLGNYSCKVSNTIGSVVLGPVFLSIKNIPVIEPFKQVTYVDASLTVSLFANATGDEPFTYKWFKNGSPISGQTLQMLTLESVTKSDEALYRCAISNDCATQETNETKLVIAPQVCMVTNILSADSNKNMLIWDRNSSNIYNHYNVYREGYRKDEYTKIGEVKYKDVTVFTDSFVNPKSQAYVYKITAVDVNGKETDINACAPHKTIHLLVTRGIPSGVQLDWDEYIGFDYKTYHIFRSENNTVFTKVHDMASTSRTWTDFDAPNEKLLKYYVCVDRNVACTATSIKKAGAGPLASAISNMEDNSRLRSSQTTVNFTKNTALSIFPNPFESNFKLSYTLTGHSDVVIVVSEITGRNIKTVLHTSQNTGKYTISYGEQLQPGIYLVYIKINNENAVTKVIKIK